MVYGNDSKGDKGGSTSTSQTAPTLPHMLIYDTASTNKPSCVHNVLIHSPSIAWCSYIAQTDSQLHPSLSYICLHTGQCNFFFFCMSSQLVIHHFLTLYVAREKCVLFALMSFLLRLQSMCDVAVGGIVQRQINLLKQSSIPLHMKIGVITAIKRYYKWNRQSQSTNMQATFL